MSFEVESKTFKWLLSLKIISPADVKQLSSSSFQIKQSIATQFQNGTKVGLIVLDIYKKRGLAAPTNITHLKQSSGTAAQLYNWNILNDTLRKLDFEIDSETKNLIINGDRQHLAMVLRNLLALSEADPMEDSLETEKFKAMNERKQDTMKQSLTLSRSEEPAHVTRPGSIVKNIQGARNSGGERSFMGQGDLLQFVVNELTQCLKLSRKQAVALLSDNNKYLAHVVVKGVKGQFQPIEDLMQRFYEELDYIVEKMIEQNDMCYYFLQIIKPSLLSKSQQIAQWGCRLLTKVANLLASKELLPLAYDWFVQETGGLSTTILALTRHPKLNQHVVGYILQFARYNVTELFTIELKKITNNDNLTYVKFMLLIFNPLTQSKISSQQLLQSGAIDYWIEITLKGSENSAQNSNELRMYCIQFLIKIWRAYPTHIEETLDQVNNIMNQIKRGIREDSQIMRFTLMEMMFELLDEFANKKNPYASIVYKKITFLFIENHEELTMREFMLRNLQAIFEKYQTIPVEIFLQPFIKQIKISESKSYLVNLFDIEFIYVAVKHRKLKVTIGLELFDLLAKTKLNSYAFALFANQAMEILIDRFMEEDIFLEYTVKLVKISLAMLYSTLKQKKPYEDQERLQAQKRAQIINFIISLVERGNSQLNEEIKTLVIHVKVQILNRLGIEHRGIQRILGFFTDVDEALMEAMQNARDETASNATETTKSKNGFHLPKIEPRNMMLRDETASQQSMRSSGTKYSQNSQFPNKDYTDFASDDEKKFLKQNGLGLKKKMMTKRRVNSHEKEPTIDPKYQQHIMKIKMRKEEEERKKMKEKQQMQRKKEILKQKIKKELEQRNVKQGHRGHEKDVEVKVLFEQNQINQNILQDDENHKWTLNEEEDRDFQSVKIVLKKYSSFIKKIFTRYCNSKGNKKDYFEPENQQLLTNDLVKLCKQKNIEKNKNVILEIMRHTNNKNIASLTLDAFSRFLEALCMEVYVKQKCSSRVLMGDLMKKILRRMSQGQNFKLEEDEDEACKNWSERVRYNPHVELPENLKKIYERVYKINDACSFPVKKAIRQKYVDCYQIVNELLQGIFKINIVEEEVRFVQQARVIPKKQYMLPPKVFKKEKQQNQVSLLEDKQKAPEQKPRRIIGKSVQKKAPGSFQKQNEHSRSRSKVTNQAEKKKIQEEEQARKKREAEEEQRKVRALQVKRKLQRQQELNQIEKQKKKQQKKEEEERLEQNKRKQKERKERYLKQQKQKVQKYKRQQQSKQKQEKSKNQPQKQKQQEERKAKLKQKMKRQEEKRKQQYDKMKKDRELSEQNKLKKKEEDERKKQLLKKQMMKKMEGQKEKHEFSKQSKEMVMKVYAQPQITDLVTNKYKQQLKAIFNYGKQFNEFKLDKGNTNVIEQKGWINLCQQLGFCDVTTANKIIKMHVKEKNTSGISQESMHQILFQLAARKEIEGSMQDYQKAKAISHKKFDQYISNLKLPKTGQRLKDYFVGLKNQVSNKKKEETTVTNPDGQKETWQINQ